MHQLVLLGMFPFIPLRPATLVNGFQPFLQGGINLECSVLMFDFLLILPHCFNCECDRALMVDELLCLQKADRFTYSTWKQALYRSHLPLTPCLYVHSHGLQTQMYVLVFISFPFFSPFFFHSPKLIN